MNRALFVMAALLVALAGCGGGTTATPTPVDPATLGQQTFTSYCAPCHGANGEGFINALNAPALNADGESYLLSDAAILAAIIDGGSASGDTPLGGAMAPLGDALSAEQEAAVLQYVHTLWSDDQRAAHETAGGHEGQ